MICNVVIHIANEQPLLADLFELPSPTDAALICTNLRTMNGQRPVFVDHVESTFVFPLVTVRFIELPPGSRGEETPGAAEERARLGPGSESPAAPEPEVEIDEDFLRRVREI